MTAAAQITVKDAAEDDVPSLCTLLNEIIEIGGTTAMETPLTTEAFEAHFLRRPALLSCVVAASPAGERLGFQYLGRNDDLPADWADIATFARVAPKTPGVGRALFAETRLRAATLGFAAIHAMIRADNAGGLAFYEKMGFRDHSVRRAIPLKSGAPVDRISKVLRLS